jgi:hypothetical protein
MPIRQFLTIEDAVASLRDEHLHRAADILAVLETSAADFAPEPPPTLAPLPAATPARLPPFVEDEVDEGPLPAATGQSAVVDVAAAEEAGTRRLLASAEAAGNRRTVPPAPSPAGSDGSRVAAAAAAARMWLRRCAAATHLEDSAAAQLVTQLIRRGEA